MYSNFDFSNYRVIFKKGEEKIENFRFLKLRNRKLLKERD